MSWDKTYSHTLALAVDRAAAAVIFNEPDITISSLCWIVLTRDFAVTGLHNVPAEYEPALRAFDLLKLSSWQLWLLRRIGNDLLERFWPGHCKAARQGDLDTSARSRLLLGA